MPAAFLPTNHVDEEDMVALQNRGPFPSRVRIAPGPKHRPDSVRKNVEKKKRLAEAELNPGRQDLTMNKNQR